MNLWKAARLSGVALAAAISGTALLQPAAAQKDGIERYLAGVRVNSSAKTVLNLFGNPNDIQIGDTPVRPPSGAGAGQQGGMGGGMMGGGATDGGGMMSPGGPGMMGGGGRGMMGPGEGAGSMGPGGPGMSGGMGGSMMGPGGPGSMGPGGPGMGGGMMSPGGAGSMGPGGPGMSGGMGGSMMGGGRGMGGGMMGPGGPGMSGGMGGSMMGGGGKDLDSMGGGPGAGGFGGQGAGGGIGGFGQTFSQSTPQQEVTWVYNTQARDAKGQKQAISYEFLISPDGKISQIRVIGYVPKTKNDKSSKGITLGSTYKDLIGRYGAPKSVMKSGDLLVCSYPDKHIEFQLMNMRSVNGYADPYKGIFKVVAIQINSIE